MENPYAHSTGPAAATPEMQQLSDYELAVGPNRDYYLPKFEEFDKGAGALGWNWPAFFVTSWWFMYRKMWGLGILNLAYPFIAGIVLAILVGVLKLEGPVMGILYIVLLFAPTIVLPMYANFLYWRRTRRLIDNLPSNIAAQPDKRAKRLKRDGGTGIGGVVAAAAIYFFVFIGFAAAISIPAYQDYTIRGQVEEGRQLAAAPKAAVSEIYAQTGNWATDNATAGLTGTPSGKYVESLHIENGSIVIVYGGMANRNIAGKTSDPSSRAFGETGCHLDLRRRRIE